MRDALDRRALLGAGAAGAAALLAGGAGGASGCARERDDGRTVSLWFSYGGNNRKVLLELVERFHAAQDAIRVHAVYQGDYFEGLAKLRTAAFAGATPTVSHVVGEIVPYLVEAGALEPLDDVGADVLADLVPELSQQGSYTGGPDAVYALPFNRSVPIAYYDADVFAAEGLRPPTTWPELRQTAQRLLGRNADGTVTRWGFECPIDWWFWNALVGQAGGALVDAAGRVDFGGEAGVRALELWQTLVHEDGTMKPPPGRDYNAWEATNTDFLGGRVALIWTSTAFVRYLEDNAKFQVRAAPLPAGERPAVPTGGTMWVMPRPTPGVPVSPARKRAGLAFLRFMLAPEQASYWATSTGYLPVSRRGLADLEAGGFFREHPNHRVAVEAVAAARPWPWHAELFRWQREIIQPRLEDAVLRARDARALLAEARALVGGT
ncbi:MAG: ABC transporter substrate-binding protein [Myxococcales bacterium]|nr:ABC transporter substrate-binding protein [Myxococcales bacterium]